MLIFLATLLGPLSSMLHSPVALELENLALRHLVALAAKLREKTLEIDPGGPPVMGLAVPPLERLAFGPDHRRNGRGLASNRPSRILDLRI